LGGLNGHTTPEKEPVVDGQSVSEKGAN
jgi:hypothetical protein